MGSLFRLLSRRLSTVRQDAVLASWACYVAALIFLPLGLRASSRLTESNGELLIAVLAVLILATQLVMLGSLAASVLGRDQT